MSKDTYRFSGHNYTFEIKFPNDISNDDWQAIVNSGEVQGVAESLLEAQGASKAGTAIIKIGRFSRQAVWGIKDTSFSNYDEASWY